MADITGITLAAIGVKHFGNPIPQAWYAAAKDLQELISQRTATAVQMPEPINVMHIADEFGSGAMAYAEGQMLTYGDARAEEARREAYAEGLEQGTKDGLQMQMLRPDFDFAKFDLCAKAAAQRTAGGDAVAAALKIGYEGGTMVSEDLGGKITLHYQSAAEAEAAFDVLANILDGKPVAEAAAQADDGKLTRDEIEDIIKAINTALNPAAGFFFPRGWNVLLDKLHAMIDAAPTAQPTPPDDERAAFEAWHRSKFATKHSTGQPTRDMHNGVYAEQYGPAGQQQMWEAFCAGHHAALRQPGALPDEAEKGGA